METMSATIGKLAEALSKVQSALKPAKADSDNPFFHSRYADLASVWDACREPLSKNGLAVVQTLGGTPESVEIITTLIHTSGEWIRGAVNMKPVKVDPQGTGSCITYGRRYGIAAILGIIQEDDDGNAASGKKDKPEPEPVKHAEHPPLETAQQKQGTYDAPKGPILTTLCRLGKVESKSGEKNGKKWTRTYSKADDGFYYTTFDTKDGEVMKQNDGKEVCINYRVEQGPKGESRLVWKVLPSSKEEAEGELDTARKEEVPF